MSECKVCKSNAVEALTDYEDISYKGSVLRIKVEYSLCNACGREFLSKEQIMKNDRVLRDAKKVHDGLFSSKEIADARIKLGLTQEQASIVFGGGRNAFSKYERGEVSQSAAMDKLIKQALKHPIVYRDLLESSGIRSSGKSISYENNIVSYSSFKAANQERFTSVKCIKMQEVSYG
ncbi:type II toxin-antitoxin system MqsA family antitoxin [Vibrio cholerae]|uniref:type II toxin-antitoxin system MqsA family antitoxin n=1 Tax=Vibrio cholerae TaxID=666 RepID=UPI000D383741|nr:type II toxin-antitoxin system MqsA family antitoxin [Vibrio cholerae]AWB72152.1 Antitoxin MqsA [Vibrio cholerae]EGQ9837186.1 type II toxin-antitoxin system MqsA family antitoxin [Vibrio cholerae]EJK2417375.1 type II toxin-antitoxin system MqsA family antitoxin [Vibrio cholerae]EJL6471091.1 type II toxin-antitoxin system MqsA family antitoxin [Vibrio cholerae]EJL6717610.1 type II toxin-antitoxin system MqsA family antitoxin [Vibrio cholerae]